MTARPWSRFYPAWYFCIGAGFLLLGFRALIAKEPLWTVILRWVIAAGFFVLSLLEKRGARR